jgi:hypothetical protein
VNRYNDESTYKEWFDENYSQYSSIYQAVGLEEPKVKHISEQTTDSKLTIQTSSASIDESSKLIQKSTIICGAGTIENMQGQCVAEQRKESSEERGGCLIATATYGSEMAPQVQMLREIRDNQLMNTKSGSAFMSGFNELYYTFSPTIADMERESPVFKEIMKAVLTPMLSSLTIMENAESESEVLELGLSVIALNLGIYVGLPAIIVIGIKKRN